MASSAEALFPAVRAGLHCGEVDGIIELREARKLFPAVRAGLHCGRRRSRHPWGSSLLFPAVRAGLHCGRSVVQQQLHDRRLFPAVRAGLHCGYIWTRLAQAGDSSLPGREGRAPLRPHPIDPALGVSQHPLPGREGRAPLRPRRHPHPSRRNPRLFPAVRAGLHCGRADYEARYDESAASSRP